jgi:hypothetical protein
MFSPSPEMRGPIAAMRPPATAMSTVPLTRPPCASRALRKMKL